MCHKYTVGIVLAFLVFKIKLHALAFSIFPLLQNNLSASAVIQIMQVITSPAHNPDIG